MTWVALVVVAVAGVGAGLVGGRWRRIQRNRMHRIDGFARRLDGTSSPSTSTAEAIQRLEVAVSAMERRVAATEAEAALLTAALESLPVPVVVASTSGKELLESRAAGEPADHTRPIVAEAVTEAVREATSGLPAERRLELIGPPRRSLLIEAVPAVSESELHGVVAIVGDRSEVERVDAIRRDFVANISHELKTPAGSLSLLAETLLAEDDDEVRQRLLERVHSEAYRLGRIIDELLQLADLEGSHPIDATPVDLDALVEEALDLVEPAARRRGTAFDVADLSGLAMVGERRLLLRAVVNLLENAVKYSEEQSVVSVEAEAAGPRHLDLHVVDRGIGIPASDLDRIFERFYRVDRARSRASGGTGLGLAIVRHIAERHGGNVLVESHEGEGSRFTLRVPRPLGEGVG